MIEKGIVTKKLMITSSHYPLICSAANKNCQKDKTLLKDYFNLMFDAGIKFYIGAHYHVYERIYPYCSNGTIQNIETPYNFKD